MKCGLNNGARNDILKLYEKVGEEGIKVLRQLTKVTTREENTANVGKAVKKTGNVLELILEHLKDTFFDTHLDHFKMNQTYAFCGLIEHENLKELEPILRNTVKIITSHRSKRI